MKLGLWMMVMMVGCRSVLKINADAEMEEREVIHVVGKVMCQDCSSSWNEWVQGARPIKGTFLLSSFPHSKRKKNKGW